MKLIGAGLPRTATLSQKIALEMLGLSPCYHMVNVLGNLGEVPRWRRAAAGDPAWDEIFDGFQATVDWPSAFFYRQLAEVYADAKVLLSVREPDEWVKSMEDTIWGVLYGDSMIRDLSSARTRIEPAWRDYMDLMAEMWQQSGLLSSNGHRLPSAEAMGAYNEQVKAGINAPVPFTRVSTKAIDLSSATGTWYSREACSKVASRGEVPREGGEEDSTGPVPHPARKAAVLTITAARRFFICIPWLSLAG